ncbi:MAG: CPBP family intramembrane metalloprotease [Oscillospiraceae bacterium]|nr:CPBP family intramembrane metalloprotease [Oscillospiraceae bacterium]
MAIFLAVQVAVFFAAEFVIGLAVGARGVYDAGHIAAEVDRILADMQLWVLFGVNAVLFAVFYPMWRATRKRLPKHTGFSLKTVALTAGMSVGMYFVISAVVAVAAKYFPSYDAVSEALTGGGFAAQFFAVGIAAPVVEELCFRGVVFNRLLYWMPVWVAAVIQSALFGLIHMNMLQGLYAFVLGLVISWVYIRFRSMWLAIISHMAINMMNVFLVAAAGSFEVPEAELADPTAAEMLTLLIPGLVISGLFMWRLLKQPKTVNS